MARTGQLTISVGIPAYNRSADLVEALRSISEQTQLPAEITICEDVSPERLQIRAIAAEWTEHFAAKGCRMNYIENAENLGYDRNVRQLFEVSTSDWVMLMGNDDVLLPDCIRVATQYLETTTAHMVSRAFVRFNGSLENTIGTSRIGGEQNKIFRSGDNDAGMVFRLGAFVSGLLMDRAWAVSLATPRYDGGLFYQIYLSAEAFAAEGVGYIAEPLVGARLDNPPLFGSASSERGTFTPGSYTAKARGAMWRSALQIARDVSAERGVALFEGVRNELMIRQSFHVFEMMAGSPKAELQALRDELISLDLFTDWRPRLFYALDSILGRYASPLFAIVRRVVQR
jgi:glycosyltransferase involved in cell wall biosynthesis